MKRLLSVAGLLAVTTVGIESKPISDLYPGAALFHYPAHPPFRSDVGIRPPISECAYTTSDAFEKVAAFYEKRGKKYHSPDTHVEELSNGQMLKHAVFILDRTSDVSKSLRWVILERPFPIGALVVNGRVQPQEIRDITRISLMTRVVEGPALSCAK